MIRMKRYTAIAFPAYRFRPGEHPHPTAHPDGHSYEPPGARPAGVVFRGTEDWRDSPDYLYGCDLYNHAYWWEAHESWEGLWQLTDKAGCQGQFLQTLIQVAACHLKLCQGKLEGVLSLRASSRRHLLQALRQAPGDTIMGLDLRRWSGAVDAYYATRLDGRPLQHDPRTYPYIVLPP